MKMFVMAKYRTRIARTQNIFVRKWTWPSGRVTAGSRSGRRVPEDPGRSEVLGVVFDHPLDFVFVNPRHAGAAAAPGAAPMLLAAAVRATASQLARPRDHLGPPRRASARGAS